MFMACHCSRIPNIFSAFVSRACVSTGVFQSRGVCMRSLLEVFQVPVFRLSFDFQFLLCEKHVVLLCVVVDGLHFVLLSCVSGFLGLLHAVVLRDLVLSRPGVFHE